MIKLPPEKIGVGILNPRPEHKMLNIKHRDELLQQIAAGVNKHERVRICDLEVTFTYDGTIVLKTDLQTALDYLANDIYWNESSSWSEANLACVDVM